MLLPGPRTTYSSPSNVGNKMTSYATADYPADTKGRFDSEVSSTDQLLRRSSLRYPPLSPPSSQLDRRSTVPGSKGHAILQSRSNRITENRWSKLVGLFSRTDPRPTDNRTPNQPHVKSTESQTVRKTEVLPEGNLAGVSGVKFCGVYATEEDRVAAAEGLLRLAMDDALPRLSPLSQVIDDCLSHITDEGGNRVESYDWLEAGLDQSSIFSQEDEDDDADTVVSGDCMELERSPTLINESLSSIKPPRTVKVSHSREYPSWIHLDYDRGAAPPTPRIPDSPCFEFAVPEPKPAETMIPSSNAIDGLLGRIDDKGTYPGLGIDSGDTANASTLRPSFVLPPDTDPLGARLERTEQQFVSSEQSPTSQNVFVAMSTPRIPLVTITEEIYVRRNVSSMVMGHYEGKENLPAPIKGSKKMSRLDEESHTVDDLSSICSPLKSLPSVDYGCYNGTNEEESEFNAEDSTPRPLQVPFSQAQTPLATAASDDDDTPRPLRNVDSSGFSAVLKSTVKSSDEDAVTGGYLDWSWASTEAESTADLQQNTKQDITLTSYGCAMFAAKLFLLLFQFLLAFFLPDFYGQVVGVGLRLQTTLRGNP
ncbi:hypothetical protein CONPUDRAFT_163029 [Coniophora puteana RWD-64-598 SS2]|uniref:Uncharacterized protein n=1 Tax=Coniophora puteana (strain RWD-64-598) TaxID=741705 RepID=A0A5M3MXG9_CONPW|nr:uncharacterized protein CONPUDRAFT_163029 [Coniophora puteana RWD-64-598 SS2]EIW83697.1 hypothetical protein CONPUDRAFT_163029 [Coniophora puteana RWD-64-598 SS2]